MNLVAGFLLLVIVFIAIAFMYIAWSRYLYKVACAGGDKYAWLSWVPGICLINLAYVGFKRRSIGLVPIVIFIIFCALIPQGNEQILQIAMLTYLLAMVILIGGMLIRCGRNPLLLIALLIPLINILALMTIPYWCYQGIENGWSKDIPADSLKGKKLENQIQDQNVQIERQSQAQQPQLHQEHITTTPLVQIVEKRKSQTNDQIKENQQTGAKKEGQYNLRKYSLPIIVAIFCIVIFIVVEYIYFSGNTYNSQFNFSQNGNTSQNTKVVTNKSANINKGAVADTDSISIGNRLARTKKAYLAKDYQKAFSIIRPLAEQGSAKAQFRLGACTTKG